MLWKRMDIFLTHLYSIPKMFIHLFCNIKNPTKRGYYCFCGFTWMLCDSRHGKQVGWMSWMHSDFTFQEMIILSSTLPKSNLLWMHPVLSTYIQDINFNWFLVSSGIVANPKDAMFDFGNFEGKVEGKKNKRK